MLGDTDFHSLAEALKSLLMMEELGGLYGSQMEFGSLIHIGCGKMIPGTAQVSSAGSLHLRRRVPAASVQDPMDAPV